MSGLGVYGCVVSYVVNPSCYCLYIAARCMSFKEAEWLLQGSTSQMLKACSMCCTLLPEGLLALAPMHVSMFGRFLSSGLDPVVPAGALFPMQLSDTTACSRCQGSMHCSSETGWHWWIRAGYTGIFLLNTPCFLIKILIYIKTEIEFGLLSHIERQNRIYFLELFFIKCLSYYLIN